MNFVRVLGLIAVLLTMVGCGSGGGGSNPGSNSPQNRWPGTGDYSYDFRQNINGFKCQAAQAFTTQWQYCVGLTNRLINNNCALKQRKMTYENNCGSDFEETNISVGFISGWDNRLNIQCETYDPKNTIPTFKEYCEFLKNESLHKSCHWDNRRNLFKEEECPGDFSAEPKPHHSTPPPNPVTPQPTPSPGLPPPVVPNEPEVFKKLKEAGISVEIANHPFPVLPGEKTFNEMLKEFIPVLERHVNDLILRKDVISEINLSTYTSYNSKYKNLTLGVGLNDSELEEYLRIFDRRIKIEKAIGIPMDLGVEIYGHKKPPKTEAISEVIGFLEKNMKLFTPMKGAVSEIQFGDYSVYYFFNGTLKINSKVYAADLQKYSKMFAPLAPVFEAAAKAEIKVEGDTEFEKNYEAIKNTFSLIVPHVDALSHLGQLKALDRLIINGQSNYFGSDKLNLAISGEAAKEVSTVMSSLGQHAKMVLDLNVETDFPFDMDKRYFEGVRRLKQVYPKLVSKKDKIKKIVIGYSSSFYSGQLTIGTEGTVADLDKVIAGIK